MTQILVKALLAWLPMKEGQLTRPLKDGGEAEPLCSEVLSEKEEVFSEVFS